MKSYINGFALILILSMVGPASLFSEEESSGKLKLTESTQKGLHFNLPEDWPIEEKNGLLMPVPVEEYIMMKINEVNQKIEAAEVRINEQDEKIAVLEKALQKPRRLRNMEEN